MSSTNNQNNIYPKSCTYGCNTQIYWNNSVKEYWEVFTKKKHICPNRSINKPITSNNTTGVSSKPTTYYSKKPFVGPKPKMSNSFELLTGPTIEMVQKKYEILSDIVITEYNGRIHGSQQNRDPKTGLIDLLVYYEVPIGQREEVKRKFSNLIKTFEVDHYNYR